MPACAPGNRAAQPAPDVGCFALIIDDQYGALSMATGLRVFPAFIGLDSTPVGPRGRRLRVPATWLEPGLNPEWVSWRFEDVGLVLTFIGPSGTVEVALRRTPAGYSGETATPFPHALPPVQVGLRPSSCAALPPGTD